MLNYIAIVFNSLEISIDVFGLHHRHKQTIWMQIFLTKLNMLNAIIPCIFFFYSLSVSVLLSGNLLLILSR